MVELSIEDFTDGRGDSVRDVRRVKLKAANIDRNAELSMTHLGLLRDELS